ncbi:hypothetical protein HYQ46_010786 [Verticillium longisporum]|nr:hypothetical protein HYQ46_010786 [Verticillium longisporum]
MDDASLPAILLLYLQVVSNPTIQPRRPEPQREVTVLNAFLLHATTSSSVDLSTHARGPSPSSPLETSVIYQSRPGLCATNLPASTHNTLTTSLPARPCHLLQPWTRARHSFPRTKTYTPQCSRQQIHTPSFALQPNTTRFTTRDHPPRSTPIVTMNGSELPVTSEAMSQPQSNGMWTTPVTHGMRPRPATIHEGFSFPSTSNRTFTTPLVIQWIMDGTKSRALTATILRDWIQASPSARPSRLMKPFPFLI